jgi:hypothetical protein
LLLDANVRSPEVGRDGGAARRPVFFLHIPKTAGTSFLLTLENLFGGHRLVRLDMSETDFAARFGAVMAGTGAPVSCLAGHIPLHALGRQAERFRVFTILRNPIARVFSLYRFLRKASPQVKAGMGLRWNYTFEEFISSRAPGLYSQTNNGMCRLLADDPGFTDPASRRFAHDDGHAELIGRACALLERIDFGLAEDMPGTHRIIRRQWNIPFALDETTLNTTELDTAHEDWRNVLAVVQRNQLDIALYERARGMYRSRLAAIDRGGEAEGGEELRGVVFQPELGTAVALPDVAGRQGFHAWEKSGIAWLAEGAPARVHFEPPAPISRIVLRMFGIGAEYPFDRIKLHLHGHPLPFNVVARDGAWCTLETRLARAIEGVNTLEITAPLFVPVRTLNPQSIDRRSLGVALQSVMFSG